MNLSTYIQTERGNAMQLAEHLGISPSYLSQMASGHRAISPTRAVEIEVITNGRVTRKSTRPKDWHLLWPELKSASRRLTKPASQPTA